VEWPKNRANNNFGQDVTSINLTTDLTTDMFARLLSYITQAPNGSSDSLRSEPWRRILFNEGD
jgi:hypothetical protein